MVCLGRALSQIHKSATTAVCIENHGRDAFTDLANSSRLSGYVASRFPFILNTPANGSPAQQAQAMAQELQAVPSKGAGFGLLRFFERALPEETVPQPQVCIQKNINFQTGDLLFNYILLWNFFFFLNCLIYLNFDNLNILFFFRWCLHIWVLWAQTPPILRFHVFLGRLSWFRNCYRVVSTGTLRKERYSASKFSVGFMTTNSRTSPEIFRNIFLLFVVIIIIIIFFCFELFFWARNSYDIFVP